MYGFLQSPLPGEGLNGRIIAIDLTTKDYKEYLYPFDGPTSVRIGDVTPDGQGNLLVIERDELLGSKSIKKVYRILFNAENQVVSKELVIDLVANGFPYQKAEGLTLLSDGRIAILNDNDFQVNGLVNSKTGIFPTKSEIPEIFFFRP